MPPQNRYQNTTGDEGHQELIDRAVNELGMDESLATELSKMDAESSVGGGGQLELGRTLLRAMLTHDSQMIWNSFNSLQRIESSLQRIESSLTCQDALIDSIRQEVTRQYYHNLNTLVEQAVTELGIKRPLAELISKIGDRSRGGSGRGEKLLQAFLEHNNQSIGQLFRYIQEQDGDSLDYLAKQIPGSDKAPVLVKDLLVLIEYEVNRQEELNRANSALDNDITAYPWKPIKWGFELDANELSARDSEKLKQYITGDKCRVSLLPPNNISMCERITRRFKQEIAQSYYWDKPLKSDYYEIEADKLNKEHLEFIKAFPVLLTGLELIDSLCMANSYAKTGEWIIAAIEKKCQQMAFKYQWERDKAEFRINAMQVDAADAPWFDAHLAKIEAAGHTFYHTGNLYGSAIRSTACSLSCAINNAQTYQARTLERLASVYDWKCGFADGTYTIYATELSIPDRKLLKEEGYTETIPGNTSRQVRFITAAGSPLSNAIQRHTQTRAAHEQLSGINSETAARRPAPDSTLAL